MKPGDKSVCLLLLPFCVAFTWETVVAQWDFWMTDGRSFSIMCWRWEDSQLTGLCVKCLHIQEEFYLYVRKWAIYRWELFRSTSISWNLSLSYSIVFPFFFFFPNVIGIPNWVQALSTTGDQTTLDNVQWTRWEGLPETGQHNDCCLQVRTLPKKRQGQVLWGKRQEENGLYVQGKEMCTCAVGKYSRPSKWKWKWLFH